MRVQQGLEVETIREHEDGSQELVCGRAAAPLKAFLPRPGAPPPPKHAPVFERFVYAALANGLEDRICARCGQVWLTRRASSLCPVCDPTHPGYEADLGARIQHEARWFRQWRTDLLTVLQRKAELAPHADQYPSDELVEAFRSCSDCGRAECRGDCPE